MQIDHALILCAGPGTRMGEIGKKLPKALWPVYFKSLLELQIDYCRDLGIERIFINTHFLSSEIENFIHSLPHSQNITLLHEDPILDSGGAIHNMASRGDVNYMGNLLIVNADQFLLFDPQYYQTALKNLSSSRAVLFGIKVNRDAHYNETVIKNGLLTEIKKPEGIADYITYSGLGILKLDNLTPVAGATKFFQTVANYQKEQVRFVTPDTYEYWDFGTSDIYCENIKKIAALLKDKYSSNSLILKFLKQHGAFKGEEKNFFCEELNSINLEGQGQFVKNSLVGKGIIQSLEA